MVTYFLLLLHLLFVLQILFLTGLIPFASKLDVKYSKNVWMKSLVIENQIVFFLMIDTWIWSFEEIFCSTEVLYCISSVFNGSCFLGSCRVSEVSFFLPLEQLENCICSCSMLQHFLVDHYWVKDLYFINPQHACARGI